MTDIIPPALAAFFDQEDARVSDQIRRYGVSIQLIGGGECAVPGCCTPADERPFAYTVGLFGIGHPELTVVGLDNASAGRALNAAARIVLAGGRIMPGVEVEIPGWAPRILPATIPNPGAIAYNANGHYHRPAEHSVPLLQLMYPDRRGRYPTDPSYAGSRRRQPLPGEWDAEG